MNTRLQLVQQNANVRSFVEVYLFGPIMPTGCATLLFHESLELTSFPIAAGPKLHAGNAYTSE